MTRHMCQPLFTFVKSNEVQVRAGIALFSVVFPRLVCLGPHGNEGSLDNEVRVEIKLVDLRRWLLVVVGGYWEAEQEA